MQRFMLRELRLKAGYSQREFAAKLGMTDITISRYERGERMPDFDVVYRMTHVLNCTLNDLVQESENRELPVMCQEKKG